MDERNPAIGFIGAGLLGTGLALALAARKFRVIGAYSRSLSSAQALAEQVPGCQAFSSRQDVADAAELVFITTPDSAITTVAASVAWHAGQGVVHCCGASSIEILQVASDQGAVTGAFHPFQTFASLTETGGGRFPAVRRNIRRCRARVAGRISAEPGRGAGRAAGFHCRR